MDLRPICGIDTGTFRDSNGDGMGDLRGIIESLDNVQRLGVLLGDGVRDGVAGAGPVELEPWGHCWLEADRS